MIRNAVIHIANEQPLLVDLFEPPRPSDMGLVCTNVRTPEGRRPTFVDHIDGTFFFPYRNIRFVELPPGASSETPDLPIPIAESRPAPEPEPEPEPEVELEIDEDFLRRVREA